MRPRKPGDGLQFVPPLIPSSSDTPPATGEWIHEVKFDGYRTQLVIHHGNIRALTMNGHDWSARYWPVTLAAEALPCRSAIIDGEMVVQDEHGRSDFAALPGCIRRQPGRLVLIAFDLLHLDGRDLRAQSLLDRKEALRELLAGGNPKIQFSEHFTTDGPAFFAACDKMGLEGIVSKRPASRYKSGGSKDWIKVKCFAEAELDVVGVVTRPGEAPVALVTDPERKRVGRAFVTLDRAARERFWNRIEAMQAAKPPKGVPGQRDAHWIKPGLTGRVRFLKGEGGAFRHATLRDFSANE